MYYEVSNIVFKNKPTGKKMAKKYPFKRGIEQVHLFEDTTYNLYLTYRRGFSFKPHPFNKDTIKFAKVNSIVLDFDHLTEQQKDFVEAIVKGKYRFNGIYGDYSAGTKTRLYENRDIPDYKNPKWGFKVFYPVNCLCTWKELNDAFIEAVSFFNPLFSMEQVRDVWNKWIKANNRKNKINDPIFKNWILPDVAMLNSFRTQITYGVKPDEKDDRKVKEFPTNDIYSVAAFPAKGKEDYEGLEWRPEESIESKDVPEQILTAWKTHILNAFDIELYNAAQNPTDLKIQLPTSRSMVARRLKRQEFEDLVWDEKSNGILNARLYAKEIDFDIADSIANDTARTLTRDLLELEFQRNINFNPTDSVRNNLNAILHDIIVVVRQRCGLTIFCDKGKRKFNTKKMKESVAKGIAKSAQNFLRFRLKMKMKFLEAEWNPPHMTLLRKYIETGDKAILNQYNEQRKNWIENNIKEADKVKIPYTYRKRGLKKWLISVANLDLSEEELAFLNLEPKRLKDEEEWLNWCVETLNARQDDLNDVSEEDIRKWYPDYRKEYNLKWGNTDTKIDKRTGKAKSKYAEQFKDMTDEEVLEWLETHDIHRQQKKRIKDWLNKRALQ